MILSDKTITGIVNGEIPGFGRSIEIDPYDESCVQPASYDLRLDSKLLVFDQDKQTVIDPLIPVEMIEIKMEPEGYLMQPGQFVLGATKEALGVPNGIAGSLEGKSSLARLGLLVHVTAGFIDPGWEQAQITLEIVNLSPLPIILRPDMKIAQIAYQLVDDISAKPYGSEGLNSKYVGQEGPTASKYSQNYKSVVSENLLTG